MDRVEGLAEGRLPGLEGAGEEANGSGGVDRRVQPVGGDDLSMHVREVWHANGDEDVRVVESAGGAVEGQGPPRRGRCEDDGVARRRGFEGDGRTGIGGVAELWAIPGARGEKEQDAENPEPFHAGTEYTD